MGLCPIPPWGYHTPHTPIFLMIKSRPRERSACSLGRAIILKTGARGSLPRRGTGAAPLRIPLRREINGALPRILKAEVSMKTKKTLSKSRRPLLAHGGESMNEVLGALKDPNVYRPGMPDDPLGISTKREK